MVKANHMNQKVDYVTLCIRIISHVVNRYKHKFGSFKHIFDVILWHGKWQHVALAFNLEKHESK